MVLLCLGPRRGRADWRDNKGNSLDKRSTTQSPTQMMSLLWGPWRCGFYWCQGGESCTRASKNHFPLDSTVGCRTGWQLGEMCSVLPTSTEAANSCTASNRGTENASRSLSTANASGVDGTVKALVLSCHSGADGSSGTRLNCAREQTRINGAACDDKAEELLDLSSTLLCQLLLMLLSWHRGW